MNIDEVKQILFIIREYATLLIECVLKLEANMLLLPPIDEASVDDQNNMDEQNNMDNQNNMDGFENDYCSNDCVNDCETDCENECENIC